jgi:hypothetical protein
MVSHHGDPSLGISGKIAVQCFNLATCRTDRLYHNCSHTSQRTAQKDRALVETLAFRHIRVVHDECAMCPNGMKFSVSLILKPRGRDALVYRATELAGQEGVHLAVTCR